MLTNYDNAKAESLWRTREKVIETRLTPIKGAIIVRLDGRAFHTLTKHMQKPIDSNFYSAMNYATEAAINAIPSVFCAYCQSDEISLVIANTSTSRLINIEEGYPFAGRVQKLVSILASAATYGFSTHLPQTKFPPLFDGRALEAKNVNEIETYMRWRMADCAKNAVSSYATAHFGHKAMLNVPTSERRQMLMDANIDIPDFVYFGRLYVKQPVPKTTVYTNKKTGEVNTITCERNIWIAIPATPENISNTCQALQYALGAYQ